MFREPKRLSEEGQKLGVSISATRELLPSEDRLAALAARLTAAGAPATTPAQLSPTLGRTGILTAFYGNPRQVWLSLGVNF